MLGFRFYEKIKETFQPSFLNSIHHRHQTSQSQTDLQLLPSNRGSLPWIAHIVPPPVGFEIQNLLLKSDNSGSPDLNIDSIQSLQQHIHPHIHCILYTGNACRHCTRHENHARAFTVLTPRTSRLHSPHLPLSLSLLPFSCHLLISPTILNKKLSV